MVKPLVIVHAVETLTRTGRDPLVAFRCPPADRARLDQATEALGLSISDVLRAALSDWLKTHENVTD